MASQRFSKHFIKRPKTFSHDRINYLYNIYSYNVTSCIFECGLIEGQRISNSTFVWRASGAEGSGAECGPFQEQVMCLRGVQAPGEQGTMHCKSERICWREFFNHNRTNTIQKQIHETLHIAQKSLCYIIHVVFDYCVTIDFLYITGHRISEITVYVYTVFSLIFIHQQPSYNPNQNRLYLVESQGSLWTLVCETCEEWSSSLKFYRKFNNLQF